MNKSKKIKLSICIATLNRAYYLEQILESISQQYQENIELVIVDGNSTDNTSDVINKIRINTPNI